MASNDLNTWVSDNVMVLLGYSEIAIVKYLIAMAKKSKSPAELVPQLVDCGFPSSGETRNFAEEIYARAPRKTATLYQQEEAEAAMLLRKQKTFTLLEADDHNEDEGNVEKKSASESR